MAKSRVANVMLQDVPWDGDELASPLTLPGALLAPSYVEQTQIAKPANPAAGKLRLYPKADGKYYTLNSAGVETEIGSGAIGPSYTHPDPFSIGTITVTTKATLKAPDITGNMTFTPDNTYDIGASGATRPKTIWVGTSVDTPLVKSLATLALSGTQVNLQTGGTTRWIVQTALLPNIDGASDVGSSASRVRNLYLYSYTEQRQISTPANPPAGSVRIYPKTDGKLYMLSSTGVEVEIGTGGSAPAGPVPDPLILENGLFVNDLVMMENLTFITVPGPRIRGDMYSSPNSNRLMFESSAINQGTFLGVKPSGTGSSAAIVIYSKDDTPNSPYGILWNDSTQVIVGSGASGTGTSLPLSIWSNGEKWKIPVTGHLLAGADNTFDIGANGASRPRNVYVAGALNVGSTALASGAGDLGLYRAANQGVIFFGGTGNYLLYSPSNFQFAGGGINFATDNTYDIGASGATRPRDLFLGRNLAVVGTSTLQGRTSIGGGNPTASSVLRVSPTAGLTTGTTQYGIYDFATLNGATTAAYGLLAGVQTNGTGADIYTIYAYGAAAGGATTRVHGVYVENMGINGNVANAYGIYIRAQTGASTTNIGLYNAGTTELAGNLTLSGTGRRILSDFSNGVGVRTMVQTNVANNVTALSIIPAGTSRVSTFRAYNTEVATNSPFIDLYIDQNLARVATSKEGSGTTLPLTLAYDNIEYVRLDSLSGALSGPGDVRLNAGAYYNGTDWVRYNTATNITHLNLSNNGQLNFYNAPAGTGAPAWVSRFSIAADGTVGVANNLQVGGALSVTGGIAHTSRYVSTQTLTTSIAATPGGTGPFEIGTTGGGAAMMAFHRHGSYAVHFGLDSDNQFRVGGWSMGSASYRILTDGDLAVSAVGNRIVQRTPEGYINGTYINMTADVAAGVPVYVAGQAGDNYMRWWPRGVLVPSQQSYSHGLSTTANQAWNICTISGALATTWLNNQSSYFAVKPGVFAIYVTVAAYYSTGIRIYTDGALRFEASTSQPEFAGGIGGGWVGQVNSSIQFYGRGGVSFSGTVVVTWVPVPGSMS